MSTFRKIFGKDKDASTNSPDRRRYKSASSTLQSAQPTDESYASSSASGYTNSSVPVSPFSSLVKLPAIDVTDLSSLDKRHQSPTNSSISTVTITHPNAINLSPSNSLRFDPKSAAASNSSRNMPRPSSSAPTQWRSEPGNALITKSGGKHSRRGSKVAPSDDGHAKPEPLNRHELMRRAMATAQDYQDHSGDETGSVFEDDHDHLSTSHHSHTVHANHHSAHYAHQPHPNNSTPVIVRRAPSSDRPGDGNLSMDAFDNAPQLVNANNGADTLGQLVSMGAASIPSSPSLTASSTMPTLVTPAPIRAEVPRSDSLEDIINRANVYAPVHTSESGLAAPSDSTRVSPQRASTLMETTTSPQRASDQVMTKSASSGALLKPTDIPTQQDGSPRWPSNAGSTNGLAPGPFARIRKNSNCSNISKANKAKKGGPAAGIAGALAASGIAGMGVGHAGVLQHSQAALSESDTASTKKIKETNKAGAGLGDEDHVSSFGGGIYRDPSTGSVLEKDEEGHATPLRPHRDRSGSSFMSYDGSVTSDHSCASGLGAAAGFGAASAALLSSIGGVPGMPITSPLLTPEGIHHIGGGGLVPPEAGAPNGGGDHIDGETTWPEDVGPQITGFAVASSKRNHEFHQLFPQVPGDDYLIEDYGCAFVREILIQGRLYISENHLCFKANIFGWVTNVVLPFSEIISIEKRMTAFVIPNAIQISTLQSKHNFTSFLSRDATYDLTVNIWKLSHPGVPIAAADQADLSDEYSEIDEGGDDSATAAGVGGDGKGGEGEKDGKDGSECKQSKRARLKRKLKGTKTGVRDENLAAVAAAAARSGTPLIPQSRSPAPGGKRVAHPKTKCPCEDKKEHFPSVVLDTTYPAVPEKIYNLLFTSTFMKQFWTDNQKLMDLQISEWSPSSDNRNLLSRNISYIKPLAGGFGPKQTKCMLTDENLHVDFDNYVVTLTTTKTPDVPSGGSFSVKTKTCITWAGTGNVSHVYVTCQVEWSGRSMLKSIVDKACLDGQKQYYKELNEAVRKYLTDHTSEFKEEGDDAAAVEEIARAATPGPNSKKGAAAAGEANAANTDKSVNASASGGASSSGASGDGGIVDKIKDGFGMVGDLVGGALEMIGVEQVSLQTLIFGFVILVLLLSNLYTLRRGSSSLTHSTQFVQHLDWMQASGINRGYLNDQGYYGPMSPGSHHSDGKQGARVMERVFAPNVYITPPGGNDASPDAIARTVAEVLERLYQQNVDRFGSQVVMPRQGGEGDAGDVRKMLVEAEAQIKKLEMRIRAASESVTKGGEREDGGKKRGKVEL